LGRLQSKLKFIRMKDTLLLMLKGGEIMKMSVTEIGQGMVEYSLIIVLVAVVVILAVTLLGPKAGGLFSTINSSL